MRLRLLVMGTISLVGLGIGYGVIFSFYVAGLFGDKSSVPPALWERALRGTILLGPFFGGFVLLGFLAWRHGWSAGVLPWATGAAGVLVVARRDAGILTPVDLACIALSLLLLAHATRPPKEKKDERDE